MLDTKNSVALRMQRQFLAHNANVSEYDQLFREMSPVPTVYWCCPGEPPSLAFRADFNDHEHNHRRRALRKIVKGRYQNGSIAYVDCDDLELYAALYNKPLPQLSQTQETLLELLEHEAPMNIQMMKEATGLLVKEITPALHRLQEAFVVYEDQVDNEWDRGWYLFRTEFPQVDMNRYSKMEAMKLALVRFAKMNVVFGTDNARSFYKLPVKLIQQAVDELVGSGQLVSIGVEYVPHADADILRNTIYENPPAVYVLHRNDFLVKSNEHLLKAMFSHAEYDVLQYILIDGEFKGAVVGRFKNGPFVLEDVILDMSGDEASSRRTEIIEAVYAVNSSEHSPLKRYHGDVV